MARQRLLRDNGGVLPQELGNRFPPVTAEIKELVTLERPSWIMARDGIAALLRQVLADELALVKLLPVMTTFKVKGVGASSVGALIGAAGVFNRFDEPAKVWKYFGRDVRNGEAPRRKRGQPAGFSPQKRAMLRVIGMNFLRSKSEYYYDLYLSRKDYELAKLAREGIQVLPALEMDKDNPHQMSAQQVHWRALIYAEKRFLLRFLHAWHAAGPVDHLIVPPLAERVGWSPQLSDAELAGIVDELDPENAPPDIEPPATFDNLAPSSPMSPGAATDTPMTSVNGLSPQPPPPDATRSTLAPLMDMSKPKRRGRPPKQRGNGDGRPLPEIELPPIEL